MKICIIGTRGFPKIQGGVEKHCEALYVNIAKLYNAIDKIVFITIEQPKLIRNIRV